MFTGIVDGIATVFSIEKRKNIHQVTMLFPDFLVKGLKIGSSVAHNGCCLTVKYVKNLYIVFDIIEETLKNTNLILLQVGSKVNIERSLQYGNEISGHLISGHIMDTAEVFKVILIQDNYILWLKIKNTNLLKYIFYKGFISIDGISLTIGKIINNKFCVYLIPETLSRTTIKSKKNGSLVNIEIDFHTQIIVDTTEKFFDSKIMIKQ